MENKRGPNDLEKLLEQREYKVQTLEKDLDRVSEERDNFERMLRSGDDTKWPEEIS